MYIFTILVMVATVVVYDCHNNNDDDVDDDDDNDMLSAEYFDGALAGRICGTVYHVCGAKEGGTPTNCRVLPDFGGRAVGVAEVGLRGRARGAQ
jgi:hypothetical protein